MPSKQTLGGVLHRYQRYDPIRIPPPWGPAAQGSDADLLGKAMEGLLEFGEARALTEEDLADAVVLSPEDYLRMGPTIESLRRRLEERRRRLLERYDPEPTRRLARRDFAEAAAAADPPDPQRRAFAQAVRAEQLHRLERLWYAVEHDKGPFAKRLLDLMERLGTVYELDTLLSRWTFSGREVPTVPRAIEIREELEAIERLLEQLREAARTARIVLVDLDALREYAEGPEAENLAGLQQEVRDLIRRQAEAQGLSRSETGYALTPRAMRLFQDRLLGRIFSDLAASRTGRHPDAVRGEGNVERTTTRPYEFGDSIAHIDAPGSLVNAMLRGGRAGLPIRMEPRDIEVHVTANTPKCATVCALDMSGSMRYGRLHVAVKQMALALEGLVRREFPGDMLEFLEMASFARPCPRGELVRLMPKPVTIFDSVVRLKADMADPRITPEDVPPHFTNVQHALLLARRRLATADTPNRQVILITDGLPTAHFEASDLYLLYPPHRRTEEATIREAAACRRDGIVVNIFLLSGSGQTQEDIQFAYRIARAAAGRVFLASGRNLDRFVLWDYRSRRRAILS
jgi:uncharacterized protein with von Willebrand factor type A (vWA) domain